MDDTATNIFLEIKEQLGALNANMALTLNKLTDHESRIARMEQGADNSLKSQLLPMLAKALIVAVTAICTLAGGGSILQKIFTP